MTPSRLAIILLHLAFFLTACFAADNLKYERYDGHYFERNDSGLTGDTSYLVITSQEDFDKIFAPAATMGGNKYLPKDTFDSHFVVATIYRSDRLRSYGVRGVSVKNDELYVSYSASDAKQEKASFRSPLILVIPKGNFSAVIFVQNGKKVSTVHLSRGNLP